MSEITTQWKKYQTSSDLGKERWAHPVGINISQIDNKSKGRAFGFSYLVTIPARLTGKPTRIRKQYNEFEHAAYYANEVLKAIEEGGTSSFALSPAQTQESLRALKLLDGSGLSLIEAVERGLGQWEREHQSVSLSDTVDKFIAEKTELGLRRSSIRTLKSRLDMLQDCLGERKLTSISHEDIAQVLEFDLKELDVRTRKNYLLDFSTFFNWCIKKMLLDKNPTKPLSVKNKDWEPPCILTLEDVKLILTEALTTEGKYGPLHVAYHVLQLFVGLRSDEVFSRDKPSLHWEAIDFSKKQVRVDASIAKKRRLRVLDMPDNAIEWLTPYKDQSGPIIPYNGYDRPLATFRKKCGFSNWAVNQKNALRHTFASMHYVHYNNEHETIKAMGHKPNESNVLFDNYRNVVDQEDAKEYFNLLPSTLLSQ